MELPVLRHPLNDCSLGFYNRQRHHLNNQIGRIHLRHRHHQILPLVQIHLRSHQLLLPMLDFLPIPVLCADLIPWLEPEAISSTGFVEEKAAVPVFVQGVVLAPFGISKNTN